MLRLPYKKLQIWQKAMILGKEVYFVTRGFPAEERFGLSQQMRRAAVSIASNIAEGSQRNSDNEFRHFIAIAKGSLAEIETQCLFAKQLEMISEIQSQQLLSLIEELQKMMRAFLIRLKANH